jgi:phosphoesterase RecJ-like protein
VVIPEYASASQVAYALFKELYIIDEKSATCFYAALLSDTRYFTTASVDQEVFEVARSLVELGADPKAIAYHFTQRKPLSAIRILQKALARLELRAEAKVATLFVTQEDIMATGATMPDMEGIVDHARSLSTVEIALFAIELEEGIRISLRSKSVDVSVLAAEFGGGGHALAAGLTLAKSDLQETIDIILDRIHTQGLLDGKK